ncbi:hypothetical protein [Microbaculum marinum]|uniref:DUF3618 domain-containing protein n=1 Tax=Microbaculum marinum TaxID=1764581 RepID=A0AAW9S154_9HYPH
MSDDKPTPGKTDEARRADALKDLENAAAGSEVFGTSSFVRQADRAKAHFAGQDADPDDAVEVWGRRIGRGLSLLAFVGLLFYLAATYL